MLTWKGLGVDEFLRQVRNEFLVTMMAMTDTIWKPIPRNKAKGQPKLILNFEDYISVNYRILDDRRGIRDALGRAQRMFAKVESIKAAVSENHKRYCEASGPSLMTDAFTPASEMNRRLYLWIDWRVEIYK